MNLEKFKEIIKSKIFLVAICVLTISILVGIFMTSLKNKNIDPVVNSKSGESKDIGISIGGVDQQAYVARLEKNYYDFEDRAKDVEAQVKNMRLNLQKINQSQQEIAQTVLKLNESLSVKMEQRIDELKLSLQASKDEDVNLSQEFQEKDVELSVANINPTKSEDWVYLPIGSFCEGTLLTGVYAVADAGNPLPVLISLDEAFYGPNKSRIPLKGAFVIGKAYGDLVSERALIQIVAISSVLPSSHTFENEQELGYVTDQFGELGIKGQVIYNTGRQLAMSFMGGFISGGAQALADGQVTTHQNFQGDTRKSLTGNASKNSLFSGVAQSAGKLSQFYEKKAEELVPAVHIKNGAKVFFIVQKGVTIYGLDKNSFNHKRSMD